MPKKHRFFNIDGNTGACLEMEPLENDYKVIMKAKGANVPQSTLRSNKAENVIIAFLGKDTLSIKSCPSNLPKGVKETRMVVKSTFGMKTDVTIEDFACIGDDKIVVINNYGLIEIFKFYLEEEKVKKICDLDINFHSKKYLDFPISLSVRELNGICKLAISTVYDNDKGNLKEEEILKSLQIFEFREKKIKKVAEKKFTFDEQKTSSSYYHVDYSFDYKGKDILFAFQNDGDMNLDVYCVDEGKVDLVIRESQYHSEYFTAIRKVGDQGIVSVDYSGVMKVLMVNDD